ncbi:MAG: AI-2E family transporter [Ruminococcaceae bacterium]|nr:AI-2E family transporter [Oscillospiraceae bacterium]
MEFNKKTIRQIFLGVFGCILLYWLLHDTERVRSFISVISGIIAPFVFGGVLAFILNVPMRAIENGLLKKVSNQTAKRVLAVVLTFIALLLVVALVFWLLIPQIIDTVNALIPNLYDFFMKVQKKATQFLNENPELLEWLKANTDFENIKWDSLVKDGLAIFGNSVSTILGGAISAIGGIFTGVFNGFIAIVFSVYCLFQKETLARQGRKLLYAFIKEKIADGIVRILRLTNATFSNFLSGQCVEVCILGTLFAVCMAIFRMPYVPLISVVIAVTAFIPIVGAWVGCVIGAFLILVENPVLAVLFVAMFLILQLIENNMIYPRVVGTSVGLSGMWVLVAVAVGGELMGVFGMFLMIPVVSVVYTLARELTNKKLAGSEIDAEKLQPQPPELSSKFKEKREVNKKKQFLKKMNKKEKNK